MGSRFNQDRKIIFGACVCLCVDECGESTLDRQRCTFFKILQHFIKTNLSVVFSMVHLGVFCFFLVSQVFLFNVGMTERDSGRNKKRWGETKSKKIRISKKN